MTGLDERVALVEKWLDRAEYRLAVLEERSTEDRKLLASLAHRLQMENMALTGLRWAVSVAGAAAIVAAIQRAFG